MCHVKDFFIYYIQLAQLRAQLSIENEIQCTTIESVIYSESVFFWQPFTGEGTTKTSCQMGWCNTIGMENVMSSKVVHWSKSDVGDVGHV